MQKILRMAEHNELEEHDVVYKSFAQTAKEEGFLQIASAFELIARIEKSHADRFGRYAQWMEQDLLFGLNDPMNAGVARQTAWLCLNCGHIHVGPVAPKNCPVCHHDQGYFVREAEGPFTK